MKKTFQIICALLAIVTFYSTYTFVTNVNNTQNIIYLNLQNNFLSVQQMVTNFLQSLESQMDGLEKINDPNLLREKISPDLMAIAVLDKDKKFLYGFGLDTDEQESVHPIDSLEIPEFKKELGWVDIRLNSKLYADRGYYVIQRKDLSYVVVMCSLLPPLRAMSVLSYGFASTSYVKFVPDNQKLALFKFSSPGIFTRIIQAPIFFELPLITNWSFVFSGNWTDLYPYPLETIHSLFYLLVLWGALTTCTSALILKINLKRPKSLWITSFVFNAFCLGISTFLFLDRPAT